MTGAIHILNRRRAHAPATAALALTAAIPPFSMEGRTRTHESGLLEPARMRSQTRDQSKKQPPNRRPMTHGNQLSP